MTKTILLAGEALMRFLVAVPAFLQSKAVSIRGAYFCTAQAAILCAWNELNIETAKRTGIAIAWVSAVFEWCGAAFGLFCNMETGQLTINYPPDLEDKGTAAMLTCLGLPST